MGVQAIKGVEIGDGFLEAMRPGSQAHDEMVVGDDGRITRLSNRAGGIEGGMSNGQPIVCLLYTSLPDAWQLLLR